MKPNSNDNSIIPANTKLSGEFRHNHHKVFKKINIKNIINEAIN